MKVLFVGNSYTFYNDLPSRFEKLARENGREVTAFSVTEGGRKLVRYQDPSDPYTQKLEDVLAQEHFDVAFLQEFSVLPASDYDTFLSGVRYLTEKLRGRADRIILYATWGRKPGSPDLEKFGWTNESMTHALADAYTRAAKELSLEVSYVGPAFRKVLVSHPEIELYNPDKTHPSREGSALAAIVHYRAVFGQLPTSAGSLELSRDILEVFMNAAPSIMSR
ncbi:MAG: hypothetical protein ACI3YK_01785 [Eubacteriales bacterium]